MIVLDRAVGIDLGTTNSEIAMLVPSEREILVYADRFGRKTVPSAVAWDPQKSAWLVGRTARARRGKEPPPIESIKRRMGQRVKVPVGPHELAPEEISAKILDELRRAMAGFLGEKASEGVETRVDRAVITVPAYFDAPQVEATRKAGELAGLGVVGILQEPTAAAIYHTFKHKIEGGNFLVYDLGGGTFDVSILRCVAGEYQVLAIDGDNYLGGDDFDRRYAEKLRKDLVEKGYELELDVRSNADDRHRFERLVHLAQEIKESLSTGETVNVSKQDLFDDQSGESVSVECEIGRAEYEAVIGDLVERTIDCAKRALERSKETADVGIDAIDHVILVGGSTRVPLVSRRVTEALSSASRNKEPLADEVDTIVALGAAVHAAQVGGLSIATTEPRARVTFTTPLVTSKNKIKIAARVDEAPSPVHKLAVQEGKTTIGEIEVTPGDETTARLEITPSGTADAELALELRGGAGEAVASIPFVVYRGEVRPRASALSRASVIAKDVGIEVVKAGRRERRVLLERGTGLPAESQHTFFTADQSGTVVLRLLQGRLPIKTLALSVQRDLPIGTPVELTLQCDEAMRIEARAKIGAQELWATVEPAPEIDIDREGAIDELLGEAERARRGLWGGMGEGFRREADHLISGIREVLHTDPAKLSALCANLKRLLDEYAGDPGDPLQPPMHHFESELDALRRVVFRASGVLVGLDRDAWEARIRDVEERAARAYEAVDAPAWRRVCSEVQALYETAVQEEFSNRRLDDPAYVQQRLATISRWRTRVEHALSDFVVSTAAEVGPLQAAERDRLFDALKTKVDRPITALETGDIGDLTEARRKIENAGSELERIEAALERLPSLGLVTERGGGGSR
jgi:molecular chaperone DnaK